MAPIIHTVNLRKVYAVGKERVVALNDVSISIEKGEFCCIVGQSGSGKSTLLNQLADRLCCEGEFPHEIGVFLGYPLADVIGFIQNRGKNFTACGYWKVYTDPTAAQAEFDRYKKCERIYARCYYNGTPIRRLTVAA